MQNQNESSVLDYRLSVIEEQLEGLKTDMQDMSSKQNQIIEALLGNPLLEEKGLSSKINDLKVKVEQHEKFIEKLRWSWWWIVGISSFLALAIQGFLKLFS